MPSSLSCARPDSGPSPHVPSLGVGPKSISFRIQLSLPAREADGLEKAAASLVANLRAFAWRRLLLFFLAFFPRAAIFTLLFDRQPDRESLNLNQTEKIGVAQHGAFVGFLFVNALEHFAIVDAHIRCARFIKPNSSAPAARPVNRR
jgi:hypothetical protein